MGAGMTLSEIAGAIERAGHPLDTLIRQNGPGVWHCILFPKRMLTAADVTVLRAKLRPRLSAEEIQRNRVRSRATRGH